LLRAADATLVKSNSADADTKTTTVVDAIAALFRLLTESRIVFLIIDRAADPFNCFEYLSSFKLRRLY
jgi:hypothetical protein